MTIDKDQLNHAREWAEDVQRNDFPGQHRAVVAAAHVIASLPDEWVDASELRYAISAWEFSNISAAEFVDMVRDALPTPPAPRTMAEIEWSDEEHVGLCARSSEWNTTIRMMGILDGAMICVGEGMRVARYSLHDLTPLPGTQIDLRPTGVPVTEDTPEPDQPRLEPESGTPTASPEPKREAPPLGIDFQVIPSTWHEDEPAAPRPEDVPAGEPWQVEIDGQAAIGYRNDPEARICWAVVYRDDASHDWLYDSDVTLIARLVPETTEKDAVPEFDPAYTYLDKDDSVWRYYAPQRVWTCRDSRGWNTRVDSVPPAAYGPYTRIDKEKK